MHATVWNTFQIVSVRVINVTPRGVRKCLSKHFGFFFIYWKYKADFLNLFLIDAIKNTNSKLNNSLDHYMKNAFLNRIFSRGKKTTNWLQVWFFSIKTVKGQRAKLFPLLFQTIRNPRTKIYSRWTDFNIHI